MLDVSLLTFSTPGLRSNDSITPVYEPIALSLAFSSTASHVRKTPRIITANKPSRYLVIFLLLAYLPSAEVVRMAFPGELLEQVQRSPEVRVFPWAQLFPGEAPPSPWAQVFLLALLSLEVRVFPWARLSPDEAQLFPWAPPSLWEEVLSFLAVEAQVQFFPEA